MTSAPTQQVSIFADLQVQIDDESVQIRADGQDVTVTVPSPSSFARELSVAGRAVGSSVRDRRRYLGAAADAANRAGVRVHIVGRSGPIADLGADINGPKWVSGSRHLRAYPSREVFRLIAGLLRRK